MIAGAVSVAGTTCGVRGSTGFWAIEREFCILTTRRALDVVIPQVPVVVAKYHELIFSLLAHLSVDTSFE